MSATSAPSSLPLVVVATPVYNGEAFLRETMECVQAQTYPNVLHVVIDNASTDGTADIIADFMDAKVPVKCIRHEKLLPQLVNWNSTFPALPAETKWYRLLCADDLMMPEAIEKMIAVGESDPDIGYVGCIHDINGKIDPHLWPEDQTVFDGKFAQRRFFDNCGQVMAPHLLYRMEVINQHTPFFDEQVMSADTEAALRTLSTWKLGMCHEHLAHTREHDATVTSTSVAPKRIELFSWFLYLHRYAASAYGEEEGAAMTKRYKRHYLRRLIRMRRSGGDKSVWQLHMDWLDKLGEKPTWLSFVDTAWDRLLIKLKLREDWLSYPW